MKRVVHAWLRHVGRELSGNPTQAERATMQRLAMAWFRKRVGP